jgi:hypothetical protein
MQPLLASLLLLLLLLLAHPGRALLWFTDAPNNLGDLDGLTSPSGEFFLRYNNGACAGGVDAAANGGCKAGPAGHCPGSIHSFGSATSPDGVHWTDHGTMMTQFDEGAQCPKTGSGSGSVWKPHTSNSTGTSSDATSNGDEYVINFSHGGVIRFMTAPTPRGPWTPVGSTAKATKTLADGFGPGRKPPRPQDGRQWYNGRWDTANGWPAPAADDDSSSSGGGAGSAAGAAPKMYFWISASAIINNTKQVGHASSVDGVNWTAQAPAVVTDWGNHSFKGGPFESGGCAYVASVKKWYCLNGFRGAETSQLAPVYTETRKFAKTGSGRTEEKLKKERRFCWEQGIG